MAHRILALAGAVAALLSAQRASATCWLQHVGATAVDASSGAIVPIPPNAAAPDTIADQIRVRCAQDPVVQPVADEILLGAFPPATMSALVSAIAGLSELPARTAQTWSVHDSLLARISSGNTDRFALLDTEGAPLWMSPPMAHSRVDCTDLGSDRIALELADGLRILDLRDGREVSIAGSAPPTLSGAFTTFFVALGGDAWLAQRHDEWIAFDAASGAIRWRHVPLAPSGRWQGEWRDPAALVPGALAATRIEYAPGQQYMRHRTWLVLFDPLTGLELRRRRIDYAKGQAPMTRVGAGPGQVVVVEQLMSVCVAPMM